MKAAAAVLGLAAVALSVPPGRALIEQSMAWHMAVQMPLLVAAGWLAAAGVAARQTWGDDWNRFGLTGLLAGQVVLVYWMLPLAVDRAVVLPLADAAKIASLAVAGAVLRHSAARAPAVLQLFFVGYATSMLVSAGVYLATTERRLCNAYSLESQLAAGWGVAALGVALAVAWTAVALRRPAAAATSPAAGSS
jgi:hypothetical protein